MPRRYVTEVGAEWTMTPELMAVMLEREDLSQEQRQLKRIKFVGPSPSHKGSLDQKSPKTTSPLVSPKNSQSSPPRSPKNSLGSQLPPFRSPKSSQGSQLPTFRSPRSSQSSQQDKSPQKRSSTTSQGQQKKSSTSSQGQQKKSSTSSQGQQKKSSTSSQSAKDLSLAVITLSSPDEVFEDELAQTTNTYVADDTPRNPKLNSLHEGVKIQIQDASHYDDDTYDDDDYEEDDEEEDDEYDEEDEDHSDVEMEKLSLMDCERRDTK